MAMKELSFQTGRFLQLIDTPLDDPDTLLPIEFSGTELMSENFQFGLRMVSTDTDIDPQKLLQKPISVLVNASQTGDPRYFHGLVSYFEGGVVEKNMRHYRAELRPWFWFLNYHTDCRIFQNKNAPDIISAILDKQSEFDYDISDIDSASYPIRDYCFQYRENDVQFIERLLKEEGIFYYFKHEKGKHTLTFGDKNSAFKPINPKEVDFSKGSSKGHHIQQWSRGHHFYSGRVAHNDYNFKAPGTSQITKQSGEAKLPKASNYEIYHYPNNHENHAVSKQRAQRRFEAQEIAYQLRRGSSNYLQFAAGQCFSFPTPPIANEAGDYLLSSVVHLARDGTYLNGPSGSQSYTNTFTAIPDTLNFRSPMHVQRPFIASAQTAIVVGPKGEEIYTDAHGRVKVQFHWDREGAKDESSSCWIRVAQLWAGNGWGTQFIPRIGQEVVVQFLEGNPDRPLITGCVYNANNTVPYSLPAQKTQSGIKSHSTKGGGKDDYNELRFEDKLGQEEIFIQAQKDFNQNIKNDLSEDVGNDFSQTVKHDVTLIAGNDVSQTIQNNLMINVGSQTLLEAAHSITLKVGNTSLIMTSGGISIKAIDLDIDQ